MSDRRAFLGVAAGLALGAPLAAAQTLRYPRRAIRLVVPYPPGGFNDQLGRLLSQKLAERWDQPVVVENRPGGGTQLGTQVVARAAPDGHTLLVVSFAFGANPALFAKLPYDTVRDFAPVVYCAATPNLLVVSNELPARSVAGLVAIARESPGTLSYASAGPGSSTHLVMELFKARTGIGLQHVPYKGSAPAMLDLVSGRVQVMFDNTPNVMPHVQAGRLRALAVTSAQRLSLLPKLPTLAESGLAGFSERVWFGVVAPAGTPIDVVRQVNGEVNRILKLPDIRAVLQPQGVEVVGGSPEAFADHVRAEIQKWSSLAKSAGIRLD